MTKRRNKMPEQAWKLGTLTAVAQVLGDTQDGLNGYQIGQLLGRLNMEDPGAGLTKWKRLEEAFVRRQNTDGHPQPDHHVHSARYGPHQLRRQT